MSDRKGHALLIGINDFSYWTMTKLSNIKAEPDVRYWEKLLVESYYYEKPEILLDHNATLDKVILSIFYLALKAQSGDIVTITFSTHGLFRSGTGNALCLHGREEYLTDEMLYFLLRLFKREVRVVIILDICQSDGFVSTTAFPEDVTVEIQIENAFRGKSVWEQWMKDIVVFLTDIEISASVAVLATASRDLNANDGFIKVYSKTVLSRGYAIGRWYAWDFEGYRGELEKELDKDYLKFAKDHFGWVRTTLRGVNDPVDRYVESLPQELEEYGNDLPALRNVLRQIEIRATRGRQRDTIRYWMNWIGLTDDACPHLNWRGVPSNEFRDQHVFSIKT